MYTHARTHIHTYIHTHTYTHTQQPPAEGTRILQADSGSDYDSESRRKECPLFISAGAYSGGRIRQVGADSLSQTVYRNYFLILVPTPGIGVGT